MFYRGLTGMVDKKRIGKAVGLSLLNCNCYFEANLLWKGFFLIKINIGSYD